MSKLSEKFAAGKKALAERQGVDVQTGQTVSSPYVRTAGPSHGSVSNMKIELLKQEIEALKAAGVVIKIRSNEIRSSVWANRLEDSFVSQEFAGFKAEIESAGGNIQPIKVRRLSVPEGDVRYEIVFGHRRHRACLELDIDVTAIVDELDEKSMFIEMDRENRERADLRPYEQGVMYARALDAGLFSSIRKLAEDIGVDSTNASRAVALARLPPSILDCFASKLDIQYRWASELKLAVEREPDLILARAAEIKKQFVAGNKMKAAVVFSLLVGKSVGATKPAGRVVVAGSRSFEITEGAEKTVIEFGMLPKEKLTRIERLISEVLAE